MAVLDNPTLEFRRSDGSWLRVGLGSQSVGAAEVEVDLANYMIATAVGAQPQTLAAALVANNVSAATLAFRVTSGAGTVARYSSAVSVGP